ncbi:MAG: transaldolase family protein [Candidatus Paceibacterota bacterium]|jgi:transaldolase
MKIFIDSADIAEIEKYVSWGVCDGVTTNPTIFLKAGVTGGEKGMKQRAIEIAKLIAPMSYSVEVTTDVPKEILKQAREFARLAKNIAVKVTITDRNGTSLLPVIKTLVAEGIVVNVTAMTTFNQTILAAKAIASGHMSRATTRGPSFISLFAGRISEEQGVERAFEVIRDVRNWLDFHQYKDIEIIVGSVRSPENVEYWSRAGAHILTIPPEVIAKLLQSARTKETVLQFLNDSRKSLESLG